MDKNSEGEGPIRTVTLTSLLLAFVTGWMESQSLRFRDNVRGTGVMEDDKLHLEYIKFEKP